MNRWEDAQSQNKHVSDKQSSSSFTASPVPRIFQLTPAPHSTPCRRQQLIWVSVVKSFKTSFSAWRQVPDAASFHHPTSLVSTILIPYIQAFWKLLSYCCIYYLGHRHWLTFIATQCSDDFTGFTWTLDSSHVKAAFLPAKTHVDNLNLKSSKTSCASCFSPRKTQIKQICINYHIYSQQTLALSTAKWVVWEMQGEHFH